MEKKINTLKNKDYIFLEIKTKKNECMKRVVQRDIKERGKDKKQAKNDFLKSWHIYYEKFKPHRIKNNTNKFIIKKNTLWETIDVRDYGQSRLTFLINVQHP